MRTRLKGLRDYVGTLCALASHRICGVCPRDHLTERFLASLTQAQIDYLGYVLSPEQRIVFNHLYMAFVKAAAVRADSAAREHARQTHETSAADAEPAV